MARYIEEDAQGNRYIVDDGVDTAAPPRNEIGANYDRSLFGGQIAEATSEFLPATNQFFNPVADGGRGGPYDSILGEHLTTEQKLSNVGGISAGVAGAALLAPQGALYGTAIWPGVGTTIGGILGGAAGFAGGMGGFDFAKDAALGSASTITGNDYGGLRPLDQYAKDAVYNTTQGVLGGAIFPAAKGTYRGVKGRITRPFSQETANAKVHAYLEEKSPGYQDALRAKYQEALDRGVPVDFLDQRSLGEIIGDPVLLSEQRALAKGGSENYGRAAEARLKRNSSQLDYLDNIEPVDPNNPVSAADAQRSMYDWREQNLAPKEAELASAKAQVESALGDVPNGIDLESGGIRARDAANAGLNAIRSEITNLDAAAGDGQIKMDTPLAMANEAMPEYFREVGAKPSESLTNLLAEMNSETVAPELNPATGKPILYTADRHPVTGKPLPYVKEKVFTMKDLRALRSKASAIANEADPRSAAIASKIKKGLDIALREAVDAGTVTPEQAASFEGVTTKRIEQGRIYEGTPAGKILNTKVSGEPSVVNTNVLKEFFRSNGKGSREAVGNFKESTRNDPTAMDALYKHAAGSFRTAALDADGTVNAKRANNWLKEHSEALIEMPELRERLSTVAKAQEFMDEKFGNLEKTQAEVDAGALGMWLNKKDGIMVDPQVAINQMLSGQDAIRNTIATTRFIKSKGDPAALSGLRRGVIDYIKSKVFEADAISTKAEVKPGEVFDGRTKDAKLAETWNRIKPALEKSGLFTDSQMKGFDTLYRDKASQMSVSRASFPGSDTAPTASVLSRMVSAAGGSWLKSRLGWKWNHVIEPVITAIPRDKFLATLEKALLDPRVARDLQNKGTPANTIKTATEIFKADLEAALGNSMFGNSPDRGLSATQFAKNLPRAAKIAAPNMITVPERKRQIPKQQTVTANKSFPTKEDLLAPPAPVKKKPFDVKAFIKEQSPETQNRIFQESSNNPMAVSPQGAQGLSQLMPDTGKWIAKKLGETYKPLTDDMTSAEQEESIKQNVRFGDWYLNDYLLKKFKSKELAWAAYNAGEGNLRKAMTKAGSKTDVKKILKFLPKPEETIPYVTNLAKKYGK